MPLPDPSRSRVLLIGTSTYDADDLDDLPAVKNNLTDLARALQHPVHGWAREETITQVHDAQTPDEVMRAFQQAVDEAQDLLLVYYAGHGALSNNGDLHLCLQKTRTDGLSLLTTGFSYRNLREIFQESGARKKVLILDCCFSGAAIGQMSGKEQQLRGLTEIAGALILTSTPANQTSAAPEGDKYTAFTGELLLLLSDGDPDGPQELTFRDIWTVLKRELVSENRAAPQLQGINGAPDLAIARNPGYRDTKPLLEGVVVETGKTLAALGITDLHPLALRVHNASKAIAPFQKAGKIALTVLLFLLGNWLDEDSEARHVVPAVPVALAGAVMTRWWGDYAINHRPTVPFSIGSLPDYLMNWSFFLFIAVCVVGLVSVVLTNSVHMALRPSDWSWFDNTLDWQPWRVVSHGIVITGALWGLLLPTPFWLSDRTTAFIALGAGAYVVLAFLTRVFRRLWYGLR